MSQTQQLLDAVNVMFRQTEEIKALRRKIKKLKKKLKKGRKS